MERFGDLPEIVTAPPAAPVAGTVARAILAGFDRHWALFRYCARRAKALFLRDVLRHSHDRFVAAPGIRVDRMADTWEYSHLALPRARFDPTLIEALPRLAPTAVDADLLDADWWQAARARNRRGRLDDILPYDTTRRFVRAARGAGPAFRCALPAS